MTLSLRRSQLSLLLIGAAFVAASLLIPWAVYAQSDSTAPTNLTAEIVDGGVTLSWDAPAEDTGSITGYEVLRRRPRQGENTLLVYVADTRSTSTSYTDAAANEPGELYVYGVKALRGGEKSGRSNDVNVDIPEPTPPVPAKPTGLNGTATHDSVALSWDDPQDESITGYRILRREPAEHAPGQFFTIEEDTGSNATSYTDSTVEPETKYVYRVKAVNDHGASEQSRYADIETPAEPQSTPEPTPETTPEPDGTGPPGKIEHLDWAIRDGRLIITWPTPSGAITEYRVNWHISDSNWRQRGGNVFVTENAWGIPDLEPGETYTVRVRAKGDGSRGPWSDNLVVTIPQPEPTPEPTKALPPAAPLNLNSAAAHGSVTLTWDDPQDDSITGYRILRREVATETDLQVIEEDTASAAATYTDDSVEPETKYVYRVRTINEHGLSEPSGSVNAETPAGPRIARQSDPTAGTLSSLTVSPVDIHEFDADLITYHVGLASTVTR